MPGSAVILKDIFEARQYIGVSNVVRPEDIWDKTYVGPLYKGKREDFLELFRKKQIDIERHIAQRHKDGGLLLPLLGIPLNKLDEWITRINSERQRQTVKISYFSKNLKKALLNQHIQTESRWSLVSATPLGKTIQEQSPSITEALEVAISCFLLKEMNILEHGTLCRETVTFLCRYPSENGHRKKGSEKTVAVFTEARIKRRGKKGDSYPIFFIRIIPAKFNTFRFH